MSYFTGVINGYWQMLTAVKMFLWYSRRLRELGEEYYEEVRRIRVEIENHTAVHRRRCRDLSRSSQPK